MGLRFRKTISLLPGVRLNISKSGVGVSAGVPGLRGSINSSGRVTGTASIPGTGVSYQKSKKIFGNKKKDSKDTKTTKTTKAKTETKSKAKTKAESVVEEEVKTKTKAKTASRVAKLCIDASTLKTIHKVADKMIDWKKVSESPVAPEGYDQRRWAYFYSLAPDVLAGDIDTYYKLITEVNPLDDLLDYGENFEFGTDDPSRMEVEFIINDALLEESQKTMSARDFNLLAQDFVCSMALRIARDVFALLPVEHTVVHVVMGDSDVFSADFDRSGMSKVQFEYIDASNTATQFRHAMKFDEKNGFSPINRL